MSAAVFPSRLRGLLAAVALAASSAAGGAAEEPRRLALQLRWDHQFQFAGYYAADWLGYYAEAGLEVELRSAMEGGRILSAVEEVASGSADLGIGSADILLGIDRGADLVVLASFFQHSAAAYFALSGTPLDSPADLARLRVARIEGDLIDMEFRALLRAEGIDPGAIDYRPHGADYGPFLRGEVDAIPGYVLTIPFVLERLGRPYSLLRASSYGVDFYGDSLFCGRGLAERRGADLEAFVRASARGWEYALAHPEEIARRIAEELPRTAPLEEPLDFNLFQAARIAELMEYPLVEPGHVNPARWQKTADRLRELGILGRGFRAEDFVVDPGRLAADRSRRLLLGASLAFGAALALALLIAAWNIGLRRLAAERAGEIRRQEAKFRSLFESLEELVLIEDEEGRILEANAEPLRRLFGLGTEAVLGKPAASLGAAGAEVEGGSGTILLSPALRPPFTAKVAARDFANDPGGGARRFRLVRDVSAEAAATEALRRSLAERELMLRELHHRVKNNLAVMSSFLDLEESLSEDEAVREVMRKSRSRVRAMALVHESVYRGASLAAADAGAYLGRLVEGLRGIYGSSSGGPAWILDAEPGLVAGVDVLIPLGLAVNELATNAVKHAFPGVAEPRIRVGLRSRHGGRVALTVEDNGVGVRAGSKAGLGRGIVESLAAQLGGSAAYSGPPGTVCELVFPWPGAGVAAGLAFGGELDSAGGPPGP